MLDLHHIVWVWWQPHQSYSEIVFWHFILVLKGLQYRLKLGSFFPNTFKYLKTSAVTSFLYISLIRTTTSSISMRALSVTAITVTTFAVTWRTSGWTAILWTSTCSPRLTSAYNACLLVATESHESQYSRVQKIEIIITNRNVDVSMLQLSAMGPDLREDW